MSNLVPLRAETGEEGGWRQRRCFRLRYAELPDTLHPEVSESVCCVDLHVRHLRAKSVPLCLITTLQARILEWVAISPPGDLPHPGIEPASLLSPELAGEFFTVSATWEAHVALALRK